MSQAKSSKIEAQSLGLSTSRRGFLGGIGALTLLIGAGGKITNASAQDAAAASTFEPNAFIRVSPDGKVTVVSSYLEMGQGTFTGLATMAAEELDIGLDMIEVVAAPADVTRYANPLFAQWGMTMQATGGSSAMAGAWVQVREAAAAARAMLLSAAAKEWSVEASALTVENGVVAHGSSGRSAGYGTFVGAAAREPVPASVTVKQPADFQFIGQEAIKRVDVPSKINGTAIYTQDIKLPGMLVAVVAHPPRMWSKVKSFDATKAKAIPGVVAVVELPGDDEIYAGVAVLAKNTWVARQGRDALDIVWDETTALKESSSSIQKQFHALVDTPGVIAKDVGTVLTAASAGGKYIEAVFDQPYLAHAPMEPMNCLVHFHDGQCEIWNGEQWQTDDKTAAARELGIDEEKITITQLYAGGSFGRRANPRSDYLRQAVRIARGAAEQGINAPVKTVWMRENDMHGAQYRPLTVHKVRLAVDGGGKLVSWHHTVIGQSFTKGKPGAVDTNLVEGAADMPYDIPNYKVVQHVPENIAVPTQFLRSVGHTHSAVAGETMIDEAARAAGKDPYLFRREMLNNSPRNLGVLDLAAEKAGWNTPLAAGRAGDRRARGIALQEAFGTFVAQVAEVTLHSDGSYTVDRMVCAVDCGIVINPDIVRTQMEGGMGFGLSFLKQAITLENGAVVESNFHDYPVLRINAMPKVEVHIVPSTEKPTGVGEPGVPPATPAVLNAITAITGVPIRSLPLGNGARLS